MAEPPVWRIALVQAFGGTAVSLSLVEGALACLAGDRLHCRRWRWRGAKSESCAKLCAPSANRRVRR